MINNFRRFFHKTLRDPGYASRVGIMRAMAGFHYYFAKGRSSLPEAITLLLTRSCNLQCKMCGQWGELGITRKQSAQYLQDLPFSLARSFLESVSSFRPNITLFGGEPLLYPDFIPLLKSIKLKNMHCLVVTNGSMLFELATDIVDSGLDELNVSLDGAQALHDQIRGMPGLFGRITQGLQNINDEKLRKGRAKPFLNLQCTISKYNYENLFQLIEVAREVNASSLTFHNLIFISPVTLNKQQAFDKLLGSSSKDWEGFVFEPGIVPEILFENIRKVRRLKLGFSVDFFPNFSSSGLKEYYSGVNCGAFGYKCRCLSPWMTAYIFPDGEVRPCLNFSYSFGNIKTNNFSGIWNSPEAIRFRKLLKEKGAFPVCARCTELYRY